MSAVELSDQPITITSDDWVHIIGIGGIGMSGIARLLHQRGLTVTGSDSRDWPAISDLRAEGINVFIGHNADNLGTRDQRSTVVIYSSAIKPDNVEFAAADAADDIVVVHRSQALQALMAGHEVIAVAGTNGKTSTTAMMTIAFNHAGQAPSYAIGGEVPALGSNAGHGEGVYFIAEADESDRSFLLYQPRVAVVTNIEADHLDTYGTLAEVELAFTAFADRVTDIGSVVACADDPGASRLAEYCRGQAIEVITYGFSAQADIQLRSVIEKARGTVYQAVTADGTVLGEVALAVPGAHMALNSAAVVATAYALGVPIDSVCAGLGTYSGVRRRFELIGTVSAGETVGDICIYDDYAYHPTSMSVQLDTATRVTSGRLIVVFQPYRYSRTAAFRQEIAQALAIADVVIITPVYGPGETNTEQLGGSQELAEAIDSASTQVKVADTDEQAIEWASALAEPTDLIVTMGAPPIAAYGPQIVTKLIQRFRCE